MAIYRFLRTEAYEPDDVERLTTAYEMVIIKLGLKDRTDPLTELIAKVIIEIGQTGDHSPEKICALALKRIKALDRKP